MEWIALLASAIGIGVVLVLWLRSRGGGAAPAKTGEGATKTPETAPSLPERIELGGARITVPDGDGITRLPGEGDDAGKPLKMRLWGIDAPEFPDQPFGREARERLVSLLAAPSAIRRKGRRIEATVREGVTATVHPAGPNGDSGRDKYGRAVVTLHGADGASVNEALVRAGLAWPYFDNGTFRDAWLEAGDAKAGLLKEGANPVQPWEWRRRHPKTFSKTDEQSAAPVPEGRADMKPEPIPDPDPTVDAPRRWWPWAVVAVAVLVAVVAAWLAGG